MVVAADSDEPCQAREFDEKGEVTGISIDRLD